MSLFAFPLPLSTLFFETSINFLLVAFLLFSPNLRVKQMQPKRLPLHLFKNIINNRDLI